MFRYVDIRWKFPKWDGLGCRKAFANLFRNQAGRAEPKWQAPQQIRLGILDLAEMIFLFVDEQLHFLDLRSIRGFEDV